MSYKIYIYVLTLFASVFAISGINFENWFKKNRMFESKVFVILVIMALAYLASSFVIAFVEI